MKNEWESRRAKRKISKKPEGKFELTFEEVIPGILHNFSSPLNGILGRSELLEERVKDLGLIINNTNKIDDEILEVYKKISDDVGYALANSVTRPYIRLHNTVTVATQLSRRHYPADPALLC